jgi:hypothetical protein
MARWALVVLSAAPVAVAPAVLLLATVRAPAVLPATVAPPADAFGTHLSSLLFLDHSS